MSDTVIRVENLSKKYIIGHQQQREQYTALRDVIANGAKGIVQRLNPSSKALNPNVEEFWALKDVSFEVKQGDRIGIIGRNGAGKSTLLKILSRITEPTTGRIHIKGRVASLLEVGTGFHPELTGRENIYLNGAILGMSKQEIRRKFDEIVAFAEVEKFLDTPVKRYSSGMYVRLAFAVAAHLEPEILVVDEVLAVGDAQFQKKCLGKMEDVAVKEGRTVLFVSHNMAAISALCHRALVLRTGQLIMDDTATKATAHYQVQSQQNNMQNLSLEDVEHTGSGKARFSKISIKPLDKDDGEDTVICSGDDLEISVFLYCLTAVTDVNVAVVIHDINGYRLIDVNTAKAGKFVNLYKNEHKQIDFMLKELLLKAGTYIVSLWVGRGGIETIDSLEFATTFNIEMSVDQMLHTESFPGCYMCRFEAREHVPIV